MSPLQCWAAGCLDGIWPTVCQRTLPTGLRLALGINLHLVSVPNHETYTVPYCKVQSSVKPNPYTSCKYQSETQCIFNVEEHHVTLLILPVSCTQAVLLPQPVYFTNTLCNQSALHLYEIVETPWYFRTVLHLLSAVEVCSISKHRFFLLCFLHACSNSICLDTRKSIYPPVQEPTIPCIDLLFVVIVSVQD